MVSDLLVFLFEVVDAFLLVSDGFLSLADLFLVPLPKKVTTIYKPRDQRLFDGVAWTLVPSSLTFMPHHPIQHEGRLLLDLTFRKPP